MYSFISQMRKHTRAVVTGFSQGWPVSEWHKGASVWSTFPDHGHPTSSPTDQQQELLGLLGSRLPQGPAEGATETTVHAVSVFSFFRTQK